MPVVIWEAIKRLYSRLYNEIKESDTHHFWIGFLFALVILITIVVVGTIGYLVYWKWIIGVILGGAIVLFELLCWLGRAITKDKDSKKKS